MRLNLIKFYLLILFSQQVYSQKYKEHLILHIPINKSVADSGLYNLSITSYTTIKYDNNRFDSLNSAVRLNGLNDYLILNDNNLLHNQDQTITGWFSFDVIPAGKAALIDKTLGAGDIYSFNLSYYNSKLNVNTGDLSGNGDTLSFKMIPVKNSWFHLAFVYNYTKNVQKLYVNALLVDSMVTTKTIQWDNKPFLFGVEYQNSNIKNFFSGKMDDIRMYDTALSKHDIYSIMIEEDPNYIVSALSKYEHINTGCGSGIKDTRSSINVFPSIISKSKGDVITIEFESIEQTIGKTIQIINESGAVVDIIPVTGSEMTISANKLTGINFLQVIDKNKTTEKSVTVKIVVVP